MNKDPKNSYFKKLDAPLPILVKTYYNDDLKWRYDIKLCRFRSL